MSVSSDEITNFLQKHGDFIGYGENMNYMIYHGAEALNKHNLWHWIKTFDPKYGFVFSENSRTKKIQDEVLKRDDHTGITLACTFRFLQSIAKEVVKGDGPDLECSICQNSEYHCNKTTLECGHMFHRGCIDDWANTGFVTCPNCRADSVPKSCV